MTTATRDASTLGLRRALFRLFPEGSRDHYYLTLREHPSPTGGASRFSLEVRQGLVWAFADPLLRVDGAEGQGDADELLLVEAEAPRRLDREYPRGELRGFAWQAVAAVCERLRVSPREVRPAGHIDLGEEGAMSVDPPVRACSEELYRIFTDPAAEPDRPRPVASPSVAASAAAGPLPAPAADVPGSREPAAGLPAPAPARAAAPAPDRPAPRSPERAAPERVVPEPIAPEPLGIPPRQGWLARLTGALAGLWRRLTNGKPS